MRLPAGSLDELRRLADESAPKEACGLLFGAGSMVAEIVSVRNVAVGMAEFVMDPDELFALLSRRDDVLGSWHSHPTSTAELSNADREGSPGDWFQVVVGTDGIVGYAPGDRAVVDLVEQP